jgi:hypothetical protein
MLGGSPQRGLDKEFAAVVVQGHSDSYLLVAVLALQEAL